MNPTKIEWCDATWNPITGCTNGCQYCYARQFVRRFGPGYVLFLDWVAEDKGLARPGPGANLREVNQYTRDWYRLPRHHVLTAPRHDPETGRRIPFPFGFRPTLHAYRLTAPLKRRKPSRIFVCSMGDMFDPNVPDEWRDQVFATMALAQQHTFMVLTKQAERLAEYVSSSDAVGATRADEVAAIAAHAGRVVWDARGAVRYLYPPPVGDVSNRRPWPGWPLPNVWLGVSVTDQQSADERIPHLLATPAAVRFVSVEPLLGPVDLTRVAHGKDCLDVLGGTCVSPTECPEYPEQGCSMRSLDWVIVGAQTGPGATKPDPAWVQSTVDQCRAAGVPLFLKDNLGWPEPIREYPPEEGAH